MGYFLGVDIGSVSAKLALIDENCILLYLDYEKITSSPKIAFNTIVARLGGKFSREEVVSAGISGSGRTVILGELDWSEYGSPLAIASGILHSYPEAKTIIQIGGQTSLVIELEDGLRKPWKVESNPLCAAGTGRFLEQQAYRLGISLEDFARLALEYRGVPPRIAARCSVFAKSDLIHLQQKGVPLGAMLSGLCSSVARMVTSLKKGVFEEPVYFVGGVAGNEAILRSLHQTISARNGHAANITAPENYLYVEALGSALLARESGKRARVVMLSEAQEKQRYFVMPGLERTGVVSSWSAPQIAGLFTGYLGVDVGSTSTKAVVLDELGKKVVAKSYLMTAGRPLEAIKEVFRNLLRDVGDNVRIAGGGVTGSGRYLVGSFIGADLIKNEITAQTRAAAEIDPEADIIEIGGQDSKLVIKRNGVVVDYQMNKACAAGTGSFIDELAELLGVSVKNGEFAHLAFQSPYTIDLGTRCAAFMGQAVPAAQQAGVPLEVITASLSNSIANNYLSKVVGTRKLGDKVILTGAVFYNEAVVSAFQRALEGKKTIVPEHKEVSGAIGVALLSREEMLGKTSKFKGFRNVVESGYTISTFTCKKCENNCAISQMRVPGEKPTFYGSRCDLFDSSLKGEKKETAFDERERLLFANYQENSGASPSVGIPRSLMVYDYAPLLVGFLNALGAKVVISSKTNKQIMEQAVELGYTDTCFPVKLLYGHAASLNGVDYLLFPSAIRMGRKEGEENQKYTCPLVQASPYIIRHALSLEKRLLVPVIDFSRSDAETINSFAEVAVKMGFSRKKGEAAARAGIEAQREFEARLVESGKKLLERLHEDNQLGVVLFSRSYVSQDSGANLGIAEKLAQLGVVPVPLDFLPLASVNVKKYSDRPYWISEAKHLAGAALTAADPLLYGLVLTNFGCGPNSFIINEVEDIMGGKPLGQLEIDEHAAEAGIVTRLEAFIDTIRGFARSGKAGELSGWKDNICRVAPTSVNSRKTLLLPRMAPHAEMLAAAMEAFGVRAIVLPEPDERNLLYSNKVTSGKECLPYRVTLGDFLRFFYENGYGTIDSSNVEGFMAGSFGPCRLGKYALEQSRILKKLGFDLTIRTTVANSGYSDLGLGKGFERLAWKGLVAMDYLEQLLRRTRPYEKSKGSADQLFSKYSAAIADRVRHREDFADVLREAALEFKPLIDPGRPRKPVVGVNGEIYLRSNRFSNCDLVRVCEETGLEVVVSPVSEWIDYISHRYVEDAVRDRKLKKMIAGYLKKVVRSHDKHSIATKVKALLDTEEPSIEALLALSRQYLSPKCGGEAVLSIGGGIDWMENPEFAGVISVMPHGCMHGGIVAAMSEKLSAMCGKPWINLTYDGFLETNNLTRINNFAEMIRFCRSDRDKTV